MNKKVINELEGLTNEQLIMRTLISIMDALPYGKVGERSMLKEILKKRIFSYIINYNNNTMNTTDIGELEKLAKSKEENK